MPFPDDFWWGTATSSTQAEGAAPRSDWARWERLGRVPASGEGNGFATNYRDDFAVLASSGLVHHRLSLEWARLEPEEGRHDPAAVEHYREVLRAARDAGLRTWACLHHFSLPGWFGDDLGGFVDPRARAYHWARHVDWTAETFGDLVFGWKPINEPHAYALLGWQLGLHPPGQRSSEAFDEALEATHLANHEAWRLLRSGDQPVATIHDLSPLVAGPGADPAKVRRADDRQWGCWLRAQRTGELRVGDRPPVTDDTFVDAFDLIGFSYYAAVQFTAEGRQPYPADVTVGPLGYAPWPEGIRLVLDRLAHELPGRPLLVCENGIGTAAAPSAGDDDEARQQFLRESLGHVEEAIGDGAPVRGYFHWTSVDNYEWGHGFDVRFGLIDRDRNPKPSLEVLSSYARG